MGFIVIFLCVLLVGCMIFHLGCFLYGCMTVLFFVHIVSNAIVLSDAGLTEF